MRPLLASVADVQARTDQEFNETDNARVAVLLGDATAMVGVLVPDMPMPPPDTAVAVIAAAVLRALATPPDGIRTETVGGLHSNVSSRRRWALFY